MNTRIFLQTASSYITRFVGTRFPNAIPLVFVTGYPKSGTTWISQLVADCLQLPFPRHSLLPIGCPAVVHGHQLLRRHYRKAVYIVRDARDAMVSKYYYNTQPIADGENPPMSASQRRVFPGLVNKADIRDNLFAYLERQQMHPTGCPANWSDHVRSYFDANNPNAAFVRYEDLLADGEAALAEVVSKLTGEQPQMDRIRATIERFSFARQKTIMEKNRPGRSQFLRKGQSGDWRNHFTRQTAELTDRYYGDMLIKCDYEKDHSWVDEFKD